MAEDFRKLLDQQQALLSRTSGRAQPISPVAYGLAEMMTDAFRRYEQHITDLQQTANKAYAKAVELEKLVKAKP